MQIIYKNIDDVIPYANNPRRNDGEAVDRVASSIAEYGFKSPVIIDKDNVIVAGHTRYKAACKLKLKQLPCIVADDLTDAQIKAYRISDNKVAEYSSWDNELLSIEFEKLQELNFDLDLTGFEDWELDNLLNPVSDDDLQDFFVEKEEKQKEPKKVICPSCGCEFEQ